MSVQFNNWSDFFSNQKKIQEESIINTLSELSKSSVYNIESNIDNVIFNIKKNKVKINVVLPYKGRLRSLLTTIKSFENNITEEEYTLTVVEYSEKRTFDDDVNFNYIWIPSKSNEFNKSICLNLGVISVESEMVLLHDIDLFVEPNFLNYVLENFEPNTKSVLQCFSIGGLIDLNSHNTEKLQELGNINFLDGSEFISVYKHMPPFGSLLTEKNTMMEIGGFDDNIFENWGAEDDVFKLKFESYFNKKYVSCKTPEVVVFHQNHDVLEKNIKNEKNHEYLRDLDDKFKKIFINNQKNRFDKLIELVLLKKYKNFIR